MKKLSDLERFAKHASAYISDPFAERERLFREVELEIIINVPDSDDGSEAIKILSGFGIEPPTHFFGFKANIKYGRKPREDKKSVLAENLKDGDRILIEGSRRTPDGEYLVALNEYYPYVRLTLHTASSIIRLMVPFGDAIEGATVLPNKG